MNIQVDPTSSNLTSAILDSKIRPRAVVGYGVKIFHPSPLNYVTRSPGECYQRTASGYSAVTIARSSFCSMKVQATNFLSQLIAAERAQKASSNIIWILKYARKDEFSNSPLLTGIYYITPRNTQKHEDFKRLLQSFPMAWIFSRVW